MCLKKIKEIVMGNYGKGMGKKKGGKKK